MTQPLCLFGHTHIATDYEEVDIAGKKYFLEETPLQHDDRIEMEASHKYLVNWGSCGQLRDNNPWVRYALLDTGARVIEVLAVDYDVEAARDAIMKASLSPHLGDRLRSGT